MIFPHELANVRASFPLLAGYLIAADVKERIGKERGHFTDECVQKFIGGFTRWVQSWIEDAPIAFDLIGSRSTGKLRIPNEPTRRVSRDIEFGYHANTPVPGVCDNLANLFLRVKKAVGTELL